MRLSLQSSRRAGASAWLIVVASLPSCKDKDSGSPAAGASLAGPASASSTCADGSSEDPPKSEFREAVGALRDKKYVAAQQRLRNLCEKYPKSATARVWLGDAILYDSAKDHRVAADEALKEYQLAQSLNERGCALREAMHYYLMMGVAYAHLRKKQPEAAQQYLEAAAEKWPTSAEVFYRQAQAMILRKQYDRALIQLAKTFELAEQRQRPMFLRVHRSLDDWLERTERQSEFKELLAARPGEFHALKLRFRSESAGTPRRDGLGISETSSKDTRVKAAE